MPSSQIRNLVKMNENLIQIEPLNINLLILEQLIFLKEVYEKHVGNFGITTYSSVNRFDILRSAKFPNVERGRSIVVDVSNGAWH